MTIGTAMKTEPAAKRVNSVSPRFVSPTATVLGEIILLRAVIHIEYITQSGIAKHRLHFIIIKELRRISLLHVGALLSHSDHLFAFIDHLRADQVIPGHTQS